MLHCLIFAIPLQVPRCRIISVIVPSRMDFRHPRSSNPFGRNCVVRATRELPPPPESCAGNALVGVVCVSDHIARNDGVA